MGRCTDQLNMLLYSSYYYMLSYPHSPYLYSYMLTCLHAYMLTCIHAYIRTFIHTYMLTYIHIKGPPPEQDIPLKVPKKTKLYVEQTQREVDQAVDMHRLFQRDLCKLRLSTARSFVKIITDGQGPLSSTGSAELRLDCKVCVYACSVLYACIQGMHTCMHMCGVCLYICTFVYLYICLYYHMYECII
jgi:hypothetical protein